MMDQQLIRKQMWTRVGWLAALNVAVIVMTLILLGEDGKSLVPFLILYSCTAPFIGLLFAKSRAMNAYDVEVIEPFVQYGDFRDWYVETTHDLARRAGMETMPAVGIYESDDVNAFATGRSQQDSLVAISTGLIESMDFDGIEAVIAHEVAHIVNGDMVTQTLLQTTMQFVVNLIILPLAIVKWLFLFFGGRNGVLMSGLFWLAQMVASVVLLFLANLIANFFSRHREFKADDLAAQLTSPDQMIHALRQLEGGAMLLDHQREFASMQFNGLASWFDIFSTHPATERRIRSLERHIA